jgi:hypothetical protein
MLGNASELLYDNHNSTATGFDPEDQLSVPGGGGASSPQSTGGAFETGPTSTLVDSRSMFFGQVASTGFRCVRSVIPGVPERRRGWQRSRLPHHLLEPRVWAAFQRVCGLTRSRDLLHLPAPSGLRGAP